MPDHGFSVALEKNKVVLLTKKRATTVLVIQVGETKLAGKYLIIMIDTKMSFYEQIYNTEDRDAARKCIFSLIFTQ